MTLVEYADLQCPYCAQWARDAPRHSSPTTSAPASCGSSSTGSRSSGPTRTRRCARRSRPAGESPLGRRPRPLLSTGRRERGLGHRHLVQEIAGGVPGLDRTSCSQGAGRRGSTRSSSASLRRRRRAGVHGTPAFQLGRTGRTARARPGRLARPEGIVPAIDALLRPVSERSVRIASAGLALARRGDHRVPALRPGDRRDARLLDRRLRDGAELALRRGLRAPGRRARSRRVRRPPGRGARPRRPGAAHRRSGRAVGVPLRRLSARGAGGRDRRDLRVVPRSDVLTTALAALALLRLRPAGDRSHAWNAASRSASPSSPHASRAGGGTARAGRARPRSATSRRPGRRRGTSENECGAFVWKMRGRYSSGRIAVRRAWTSSVASQVGRKRTGAGVSGSGSGARGGRGAPRRPRRGSGGAAALEHGLEPVLAALDQLEMSFAGAGPKPPR